MLCEVGLCVLYLYHHPPFPSYSTHRTHHTHHIHITHTTYISHLTNLTQSSHKPHTILTQTSHKPHTNLTPVTHQAAVDAVILQQTHLSDPCKQFLRKLLSVDPNQRISLDHILQVCVFGFGGVSGGVCDVCGGGGGVCVGV